MKSEVGSRKSEVGSRKSEVGSRKSQVPSPKSEVGSPSSPFVLRSVIPDYLSGKGPEGKLAQIETLRLATHYIGTLSEMLYEEDGKTMKEFCRCGYFRENENFSFSDFSCLTDI